MNPTNEQLARKFSFFLKMTIGIEKLKEVNRLNVADGMSSDVCHSHDFCDANQVMIDAWEAVFGHDMFEGVDDENPMSEKTVELTNDTWDMAKQAHFYIDEPIDVISHINDEIKLLKADVNHTTSDNIEEYLVQGVKDRYGVDLLEHEKHMDYSLKATQIEIWEDVIKLLQ